MSPPIDDANLKQDFGGLLREVGVPRVETIADSQGKTPNSENVAAESGAVAADFAAIGPDLAAVIDAWPDLSDVVKSGILAMVKAARWARVCAVTFKTPLSV